MFCTEIMQLVVVKFKGAIDQVNDYCMQLIKYEHSVHLYFKCFLYYFEYSV